VPILNTSEDYKFFDGTETITLKHMTRSGQPSESVDYVLVQHPAATLAGGTLNAEGDEIVFQIAGAELTNPIDLQDRITRTDGLKYRVSRIIPNVQCGMFEVSAYRER
jgi:hypothetical protein